MIVPPCTKNDPRLKVEACLHCEGPPPMTKLGLCLACHARLKIRELYYRRRGWTAVDELMLRVLRARANRRLPLFPSRD
jgi:hypothetical protein